MSVSLLGRVRAIYINATFSTRTSKLNLVYILLNQRSVGFLSLASLTAKLQSVKKNIFRFVRSFASS